MTLPGNAITLLFGEDDNDLWALIQQIPEEDRIASIMQALRQGLEDTGATGLPELSQLADHADHADHAELAEIPETQHPPAWENLFVPAPDGQPDRPQTPVSLPWHHLLHNIIGMEEDEEVIAAIRGHHPVPNHNADNWSGQDELPAHALNNPISTVFSPLDHMQPEQLRLEELQLEHLELEHLPMESMPDATQPATGLHHILHHIIGTEEDEAFISWMRAHQSSKEK